MILGIISVCLCVRRAVTACSISLGGEGVVLYPVLFSCLLSSVIFCVF